MISVKKHKIVIINNSEIVVQRMKNFHAKLMLNIFYRRIFSLFLSLSPEFKIQG